jgi:signal peptidase I
MRLRNIIIIAIILLAVSSAVIVLSEQSNNLEITITTNGSDVKVKESSILFFNRVPDTMISEMGDRALIDLQSDTSNVESFKSDMVSIAQKYNYNITVKIDSPFGTDQLPMPATVKGTSMVPTLQDGQNIVLLKTRDFKVGDIVVARHKTYGLIVKRIAEIKDGQAYLMSDNRDVIVTNNGILKGLDTWVPLDDVIGVVKIY